MLKKLIFFYSVIITAVFVFSSCSDDDNPVNPGTPSGTVMYSADSISIWLSAGSTSFGTDSAAYSTSETGGVKIEFTIQSNVDTPVSYGRWGFYTNATPIVPYFPNIYSPINEPFFTNLNFASGSTYFAFAVRLNTYNSPVPRYVRLVNVKVTKE